MKAAIIAGCVVLSVLNAPGAHTREWQGNMPKPVGKLPSYPPVVCVTPNWTPEPCESRQPEHWLVSLAKLFEFLKVIDESWLGTVDKADKPMPWTGEWPRQTTKLYYEPGGILQEHTKRWQDLARSGNDVEIRDKCASACTMILHYVPQERICFGEYSSLVFHAARDARDGSISVNTTVWMFYSYPKEIREWLRERGGLAVGDVIAPAEDLWAMGYRKCGPDLLYQYEIEAQKEWNRKAEEARKEWENAIPIPMTIVKSTRMGTGG